MAPRNDARAWQLLVPRRPARRHPPPARRRAVAAAALLRSRRPAYWRWRRGGRAALGGLHRRAPDRPRTRRRPVAVALGTTWTFPEGRAPVPRRGPLLALAAHEAVWVVSLSAFLLAGRRRSGRDGTSRRPGRLTAGSPPFPHCGACHAAPDPSRPAPVHPRHPPARAEKPAEQWVDALTAPAYRRAVEPLCEHRKVQGNCQVVPGGADDDVLAGVEVRGGEAEKFRASSSGCAATSRGRAESAAGGRGRSGHAVRRGERCARAAPGPSAA